MDFFNPHDEDEPEPFKTPATKKSRPAASSVSKKATAKTKVLSDDSDGDFDPLETPAAKTPAAKKLNIGKKPAAKTPRAAAEPEEPAPELEVVTGPNGLPLHSEAILNEVASRGTSGTVYVSICRSKNRFFCYPQPYDFETKRGVPLAIEQPVTPEGIMICADAVDEWYDKKFEETKNAAWLGKKIYRIDDEGQKVRPIPIRVPSRSRCPRTLLHR